ncbi:MAG TPA: hypothetical protein VN371_04840 [Chlorobaculum sp.]|nr:hypothetical protein [Chlorobaculum sp.]
MFGIDLTPERIRDAARRNAPQTAEHSAEMIAGMVPNKMYMVPQAIAQSVTMIAAFLLSIERNREGIDEIARQAAANSQNIGS